MKLILLFRCCRCLDLDLQTGIDVLADWIRPLLALYFITSMKKSYNWNANSGKRRGTGDTVSEPRFK